MTPPVYSALGGVLLNPYNASSDWLVNVAQRCGAKAVWLAAQNALRAEDAVEVVRRWNTTVITAAGRMVHAAYPTLASERLWDSEEDPFPELTEDMVDMKLTNGQLGGSQVALYRFAVGDAQSGVREIAEQCTLSAGYYPGSTAFLDNVAIPEPVFIYDVRDLDRTRSVAWSASSEPGVYDVWGAFGYYEMLVKYLVPAAFDGTSLYVSVQCANNAGTFARASTEYGQVIDTTVPVLFQDALLAGLRQGNLNRLFQNDPANFAGSWYGAALEMQSYIAGVTVWLGTAPRLADIAAPRYFPADVDCRAAWSGLNMTHGSRIYMTATANNTASPVGVSAAESSEPVLIDVSGQLDVLSVTVVQASTCLVPYFSPLTTAALTI